MNERHLIDTHVFNIRFPNQQQAQAEQDNGLTDFIQSRLLQIVDQVFTRLCPAQTVIRIDTIELDLGVLPPSDWRAEMEQRLERELIKALREKIVVLPKGTDSPERLLTPTQNRMAVLRCFLEHGRLPANVSTAGDDELEKSLRTALVEDSGQLLALLAGLRQPTLAAQRLQQQFSADIVDRISRLAPPEFARLLAKHDSKAVLTDEERLRRLLLLAFYENRLEPLQQQWQELFQQQAKNIRRELFRHGKQAVVRHSIAWTFPDSIFADLIRLLEPTENEFIEAIVFHPALPKEAVVQPGEAEDHGRKRLREFTLAYLLTERGSRFNKKAYLASLISRMAAYDNVAAADLVQSLQEMLITLSSQSKVQQEMLSLLREIEHSPEKQHHPATISPDEAQLEELLHQAYYERLPEKLRQQWTVFFKHYPTQIQRSLFQHGQSSSAVRHRIAWTFPDSMFADLIRLLEPTENEFIEEIVFRPALPKEAFVRSGEDGSERLREFTLAYLLTERGSRFNKKEYLASLISKMAAHDNLATADLAQSLQAMLAAVSSKSKVQQEMLLILIEMQEDKQELRPQQPTTLAQLLILLKERKVSSELLQTVQRYAGQVDDIQKYCQLITTCLHEDQPLDFSEILAHCQSPKKLPAITSLAQLLILLKAQKVSSELLQAVQRYAGQVDDIQKYCQLITTCLHEDQVLDFSEILAHCQSPKKLPSVTSLAQLLALLHKMTLSKELIESVERYAPQAGDLERYCELIIACLNNDQPLDLEKITAQSSLADNQHSASSAMNLTQFRLSAAEEELAALLLRPTSCSATEQTTLTHLLEKMLLTSSARLRYLFEAVLHEREEIAERIGQAVNPSTLARLFALLRPAEFTRRQTEAELISRACCAAPFGITNETMQRLKQLFISRWLFAPSRSLRTQDFALAFAVFLHEHLKKFTKIEFFEQLQRQIVKEKQGKAVAALLNTAIKQLKNNPVQTAISKKNEEIPEENFDEEVHVENAGLVIAALYLPRLFALLGLLEKSIFRDQEAAERAVHLLQYMAEERTDRPEYQLVLNKILCGVQTNLPLIREIEATSEEKQAIDGLLAAVIKNWGAIGSTSVNGLREAFLQRQGRLLLRNNTWQLQVQEKAYDMLLDRLPWSFAVIKLPWMQRVLHVQWR